MAAFVQNPTFIEKVAALAAALAVVVAGVLMALHAKSVDRHAQSLVSCPERVAAEMGIHWSVQDGATERLTEFEARVAACDKL